MIGSATRSPWVRDQSHTGTLQERSFRERSGGAMAEQETGHDVGHPHPGYSRVGTEHQEDLQQLVYLWCVHSG